MLRFSKLRKVEAIDNTLDRTSTLSAPSVMFDRGLVGPGGLQWAVTKIVRYSGVGQRANTTHFSTESIQEWNTLSGPGPLDGVQR
jgi:hypothetical protein